MAATARVPRVLRWPPPPPPPPPGTSVPQRISPPSSSSSLSPSPPSPSPSPPPPPPLASAAVSLAAAASRAACSRGWRVLGPRSVLDSHHESQGAAALAGAPCASAAPPFSATCPRGGTAACPPLSTSQAPPQGRRPWSRWRAAAGGFGFSTTIGVPEAPAATPPTASTAQAVAAGGGLGGLNREPLRAYYSDVFQVPLPDGHRFPMDKYAETRRALAADPSLEGLIHLIEAPPASREQLCTVHDAAYVDHVLALELTPSEMRAIGFPQSPALLRRTLASAGGTVAAMLTVMRSPGHRVAANVAGGTHHAFPDRGEGFCVFNDIGVASGVAMELFPDICNARRPILVVDLDVHQGNGTAAMFRDDDRVITFSMQGANNYPYKTRAPSTYDVDLPDGTGDDQVLKLLEEWLPRLFAHGPSLVFFQAGVDMLAEDSFGRLAMTRSGLLRRNHMVFNECIARNLPLVVTMGGGYSRPPTDSIRAHTDVYRSAAYRYCGHLRAGSGKAKTAPSA